MNYTEYIITTLLKRNIRAVELQETLGKFINQSMLLEEGLKKFHEERRPKLYVFSGLYPVETQSKLYKAGKVYVFRIRSLDEKMITSLISCMKEVSSETFQVLATEKKRVAYKPITELVTITPFIATIDNKPWMPNQHSIGLLVERMHMNAEKKYKTFYKEELNCSQFVQRVKITNRKPIAMAYKNIRLLGHKARIFVNSDEASQKLAFTVLGAGLLEKGSSLGTSFCFANFLKLN